MKANLALTITFLCLKYLGMAQNIIYVSPTGVSTNNGTTEATPKNISAAFNGALPNGTTIMLLDGTYILTNDLYLWNRTATETATITIKAKNKHKAILKGNNDYSSNRFAVLYIAGCKHVVVDGLTVMHESGSLDQQSGINIGTAVNAGGTGVNSTSEYVTIKNCLVYGHGSAGITTSGTDHITFEGNIVHSNCSRNAINTSGINIYKPKALTSDSNYWGMIIRGNISYNNSCNLPFYYNEGGNIYQNVNPTDGNGIMLDLLDNDFGRPAYAKRVLVENNVSYNNGGSGIKSYKSSLVRIINNTVYHNNQILNTYGRTGEIMVFETGGIDGVYNEGIYNNVTVADPALTTNEDYAMIVDFDMNKVYNNYLIGKGAKFNNYNLSEPQFATANTFKPESDQDAARFQDAAAGNFNLKNDSPLIEADPQTYYPTADILLTTRPQGLKADYGAFEYIKPVSITITPDMATIPVSSTTTATAILAPSTASYPMVTWSSNNAGVATISQSGMITGIAPGTATIFATTADGTITNSATITVTATALPLSGFTLKANKQENGIVLSFSLSDNHLQDYFTVERSANGTHFETLTQFKNNTNQNIFTHKVTDTDPLNRLSYYRVAAVSVLGQKVYSRLVSVDPTQDAFTFVIGPNPVIGTTLKLTTNQISSAPIQFQLINMQGQVVYQAKYSPDTSKQISIALPPLQLGNKVYILKANKGTHTFSQKVSFK
jgi:hypothetical protein